MQSKRRVPTAHQLDHDVDVRVVQDVLGPVRERSRGQGAAALLADVADERSSQEHGASDEVGDPGALFGQYPGYACPYDAEPEQAYADGLGRQGSAPAIRIRTGPAWEWA